MSDAINSRENTLIEGDSLAIRTLTVSCGDMTETANVTISWVFNKEPVTGPNYALVQDDLQITYTSETALAVSGVYQCFVSNPAGSAVVVTRILPKGLSKCLCNCSNWEYNTVHSYVAHR